MDERIGQFLEDIRFVSPERFQLVMAIRELFQEGNVKLVEGIKYGA
jgi:hypothetical protein